MHERQPVRVQHQPRGLGEHAAGGEVVAHVDALADQRVARFGEMDADLVRPSGDELGRAERQADVADDGAPMHHQTSARGFSARPAAAQAVAAVADQLAVKRAGDDVTVGDERVLAGHGAGRERALQPLHRAGVVGEDEQPGRGFVEPMHEPTAEGTRGVLRRGARGFVDDNHAGQVVDDVHSVDDQDRERDERALSSPPTTRITSAPTTLPMKPTLSRWPNCG